jgi:hypothetical protein
VTHHMCQWPLPITHLNQKNPMINRSDCENSPKLESGYHKSEPYNE